MTPILLTGERVTLREFTLDDWRAVHDYSVRPEVCRYVASARVLEKAGLRYEGCQRVTLLLRDGWRDSSTDGLLEEEWRSVHDSGRAASL